MAFRHLQRFGRLLSSGRGLSADQGCMIFDFNGAFSGESTLQSVIFRPAHSRQLSSLTRTIACARTEQNHRSRSLSKVSINGYSPLVLQESCAVNPLWGSLGARHFSLIPKDVELKNSEGSQPEKKSIFQRFKETYKEYGKVLVAVHLATSAVWFGGFYYLACTGIDIVPLLEKLGFGEKVISALGKQGIGHVAVMYLLYKLATPARYTVTIVGTQMTVKQLRKLGYLQPIKTEDSLRSLFKEGRSHVKERYGGMRDEMTVRMVARREKFSRDFQTQRARFQTRHEKLRRDLERRTKLRNRNHFKNGKNGHTRQF